MYTLTTALLMCTCASVIGWNAQVLKEQYVSYKAHRQMAEDHYALEEAQRLEDLELAELYDGVEFDDFPSGTDAAEIREYCDTAYNPF